MYNLRPDLKFLNFVIENSPLNKINKVKYKQSIKSLFYPESISNLYIEQALEMYVNHLNSDLLTPLGRRLHSIMTRESIKQGAHFLNAVDYNSDMYNDPIFVVGLPRSGTTNLHNMIINEFGYSAFEYWQLASPKNIYNNPSIDRSFRKLRSIVGFYLYRYLIPSIQSMHNVNMNTYEECWHFQKNLFLCYNYVIQLKFRDLENYMNSNDSRFMFEGYKQFLLRNQINNDTHFALKCPEHLMFTDTIDEIFPESTIIWIHRHPFESISSYCPMIDSVWKLFMGKTDKKDLVQFIVHLYDRMLRKMMTDRDKIKCNIIDVSYSDLINRRENIYNYLKTRIKSYKEYRCNTSNPSFFKNKHKMKPYPISEASINEHFSFYLDSYKDYL